MSRKMLFFAASFLIAAKIHAGDAESTRSLAEHVMRISEGVRSPVRLAIDGQGVVYVSDAIGGKICRYDQSGQFLGEIVAVGRPLAIAASQQGFLFVADKGEGTLQLFDLHGRLLKKVAKGLDRFQLPVSAVFGPDRRLHIVDARSARVGVFDEAGNASSIYFYEIRADNYIAVRRMTYLK